MRIAVSSLKNIHSRIVFDDAQKLTSWKCIFFELSKMTHKKINILEIGIFSQQLKRTETISFGFVPSFREIFPKSTFPGCYIFARHH